MAAEQDRVKDAFKVGDIVCVTWPGDEADGYCGHIVKLDKPGTWLVRLKDFKGHDGDLHDGGYDCWWVNEEHLRPVHKIVIKRHDLFPDDSAARKAIPICEGVFDYFPAALAEVAKISKYGNDKHNPGEPLHWARGKSTDHANCIGRHLLERGTRDSEGNRHSANLAWRALALLQEELEAEGAPMARGAKAA